ncbi:MAG: lipopolysaccharide biosynthesis protein, partial [Thiobacillaceae bacterium]|nr:lipopolysaccharide biosynthesis protein [Thiobacillaceae bacterium]
MGPEAYGAWALLVVIQAFAASLGGMGLSSSLSRFSPAAEPGLAHAHVRLAMMAGGAAMACILLLGILLQAPLGSVLGIPPDFRWLMPMALLMAAGSIADGYLDAYFKAREKLRRQVGFLLTRSAAEIIAVMTVFATDLFPHASEALAAYVTVVLAVKLAVYPILLRDVGQAKVALPKAEKSAFLEYGYAMLPTLLVVWLTSQADRMVLGQLVSPSELGVYAFSATLASYMVLLGYAVMPLLLPRASRLYDEGRQVELQGLFARSQILFLGIMAVAMVVVALFAREILLVTAGADFAAAPTAFVVLCLAVCLDQLL